MPVELKAKLQKMETKMPVLMVRGDVEDFDRWKQVFDKNSDARTAHGCRRVRRFRSTANPNHLLILFDWDTEENAKAFSSSPQLERTQAKAGILPGRETAFFEEF
ncbi:antibiotic biosynthesis monooxygenase [Bradyrhizobium sp. B097]|uniref:antibiotic biosynthesis monooxygenase family protein n=1 Tax=Bradyrhizobium sp. B097 TaxID=3140244 RepID=UPI00318435FA